MVGLVNEGYRGLAERLTWNPNSGLMRYQSN